MQNFKYQPQKINVRCKFVIGLILFDTEWSWGQKSRSCGTEMSNFVTRKRYLKGISEVMLRRSVCSTRLLPRDGSLPFQNRQQNRYP